MSVSISLLSKILVPIDQSENATRALEYALRLAKLSAGSKVTVLCVVESIRHSSRQSHSNSIDQLEDLLEESAKNYLDDISKKAEKEHGIKIKTMIKRGRPVNIIIDTAKSEDIDLIVMGSRGLGGFKEMLFGSVSHGVTNHASGSVLIVK
jgi:nucleotide-binding universal stress UspA family protein